MPELEEIKLYFDYKSPFSYLVVEPAFALPERYRVTVRWLPFLLRIKGPGQRSVYSDWKARYSYMDARRWANRRGGFRIMGPLKVYDSTPALIGGLYTQTRGCFRAYTERVFASFFARQLEIDEPLAIANVLTELGEPAAPYMTYLETGGPVDLEACITEAHADQIFGVPIFWFRGELFWGYDRLPLLEERLGECGLARSG